MGSVAELSRLLQGKVLVGADITDSEIRNIDVFYLSKLIESYFSDRQGLKVLDKQTLVEIIKQATEPKIPKPVAPIKSEAVHAEKQKTYKYANARIEYSESSSNSFINYFNNRFEKLKRIMTESRSYGTTDIANLEGFVAGREVSVIGMVYERRFTKNGHILITLEDTTGSVNVLFAKPQENVRETRPDQRLVFEQAAKITKDDVVLVKGKVSKGLLIANYFSWPDIPIRTRKQSKEDFAVAFITDTHVGHKLFLEKQFNKMLEWLNHRLDYMKELAEKVSYVVITGDLVDGVGVYPGQEKELLVSDIYAQYAMFFELIKQIPDGIEVFVLPGNHDGVRRAEPQPELDRELAKYNTGNVHLVTNPAWLELQDLLVLAYHGASLDSIISSVRGCSYSRPEEAMVELLRRRHLSPIYGTNPIVPGKDDDLVIDRIPDILAMGHIHKNGAIDYHGTLVLNGGTWQARTAYQIKQGHIPTPAILPVYEAKSRNLNVIDFNRLVI